MDIPSFESMNLRRYHSEEQVVKENAALASELCRKFYRKCNTYSMQDLMQVALFAIVKGYRKYDPERGALSTLIYHCIKNDLSRFVYKNRLQYIEPSRIKRRYYTQDENQIFDISSELTDLQLQILKLIQEGYTRKEVVDKLNISFHIYQKNLYKIRKKLINE